MKVTNHMYAFAIALTMFGVIAGTPTQTAHAQAVTIVADQSATGMTNTIKNTLTEVTNAVIAEAQQSLRLKEFTLDSLAWSVAQNALNQITADMINWVNGGFEGNPAFVTNLEDFLLGVADETAGEFIYGPELDNLCGPPEIQFNIRAALATQYTKEGRGSYTPQCTLDNVTEVDVEAFMGGDFSQGGWEAFFELGVGSNNDPTKAYLDSRVELYTRNLDAQQNEQEQVGWGDGFLSKQNCEYIEDATGFAREQCQNVTPGALIRDTISFHVGEAPSLKLIQADEFNEVLSTLAGNLTNQAIRGTFGLLGLGGNSKYSSNQFGDGSQSFSDALAAERPSTGQSISADVLTRAIEAEEEYNDMQQQIIDDIEGLEEQIESDTDCSISLTDTLQEDKSDAEENLDVSDLVLETLNELKTALDTATTDSAQSEVFEQYSRLDSEGLIRTERENTRLRTEFIERDFKDRVDAFERYIDQQC